MWRRTNMVYTQKHLICYYGQREEIIVTALQTSLSAPRPAERRICLNNLGMEDGDWVDRNPDTASALCADAIRNRERTQFILAPRILRPVRTPHLEPYFRARDTFFGKDPAVVISEYGSRFTDFFSGKVERSPAQRTIIPFTLMRGANDRELIRDVGGPGRVEVFLAEIWRILERHARGEETDLFLNGRANVFFARDRSGELRSVRFLARPRRTWHAAAAPLGSFWQHDTDRFFFPVL